MGHFAKTTQSVFKLHSAFKEKAFKEKPAFKKSTFLLMLCALGAQQAVAAEDDLIHLNASVDEVWDSNFSRSPANDEEEITVTAVGASLRKALARQKFAINWHSSHFDYQEHPDFNATVHTGSASWRGEFGSQFNSLVEWKRDAYQVDRLEFFGKDIVERDDARAILGYGNDSLLSFHIGGRRVNQEHSNLARNGLDFEEEQGFVDVGVQSSHKSTLYLRYAEGDRTYTHQVITPGVPNLDFDFKQLELEAVWVLTPKTNVAATLASYKREGEINTGSGFSANVEGHWQMTEKLGWTAGYTYTEPAIGESSDAATKIQQTYLTVQWKYSEKIELGSRVYYAHSNYDNTAPNYTRAENLIYGVPLSIRYQPFDLLSLRLEAGYRGNSSPVYTRDYVSRQLTLGLVFRY